MIDDPAPYDVIEAAHALRGWGGPNPVATFRIDRLLGLLAAREAKARAAAFGEAIAACQREQQAFLKPTYAHGQPDSSVDERTGCQACMLAIAALAGASS